MRELLAWKKATNGQPEDHVLCTITRGGTVTEKPITQKKMAEHVKCAVTGCGEDSTYYSTHSNRAGFISEWVNGRGVPLVEVMSQSRHKSYQAASIYDRDGKQLFARRF